MSGQNVSLQTFKLKKGWYKIHRNVDTYIGVVCGEVVDLRTDNKKAHVIKIWACMLKKEVLTIKNLHSISNKTIT